MTQEYEKLTVDASVEKALFGMMDAYVNKIERSCGVQILSRNGELKILGEQIKVERARAIISSIIRVIEAGGEVDGQKIDYIISMAQDERAEQVHSLDQSILARTIQGKPIRPKTVGQQEYVQNMEDKMITFAVGPAGTGKTYLAIAKAVSYFRADEVSRIILTRPAIEAGEKLGFLPGDLQQKVDPYLRPLYDALFQILGPESFHANVEKGLIEVAPLAYMRGRTLDNAFIILDEAQNTSPSQMKMFLTRIGFGSKVVVTGDVSQKDLAPDAVSGLEHAMRILQSVEEIGFSKLTSEDVVRHSVVQKIVRAYDAYEERQMQHHKRRGNHGQRSK